MGGGTIYLTLKGSTVKTILSAIGGACISGLVNEILIFAFGVTLGPIGSIAVAVVGAIITDKLLDWAHPSQWRAITFKYSAKWLPTKTFSI